MAFKDYIQYYAKAGLVVLIIGVWALLTWLKILDMDLESFFIMAIGAVGVAAIPNGPKPS